MTEPSSKLTKRIQDIERDLPYRVRKEPKPGDGPLKRPYPPHARDIHIVDKLLSNVYREIPSDFSKRDQRTATKPQGVLYFHVLDIQDVKLSSKDFITGAPFCIYVEYECQGVIKCSYPVLTHKYAKIRIDHFAHFSANVSDYRLDEANDFVFHVYAFQNPEKHWLIGSQLLHLYNFVREIHGINTVEFQDDLSYYAGRLTYEFAWAYGAYGYGHSNQLRNTKNPVHESVCHSMFPRISPNPDDLIDNKFRVRVPKKLRIVNLHSILVRVPLKKGSINKEARFLVFRRVKFSRGRPVHVALNMDIYQKYMENDFNMCYGEYICLRNRQERLEHLTRMVEGRLRDRFEINAQDLFHPIKDVNTCRAALTTKKPLACPPGYFEQSQLKHSDRDHQHHHHHHHHQQGVEAEMDKETKHFLHSFKSAPRFSGWLATIFGYDSNQETKPVEKWHYHVPHDAYLGGGVPEVEKMTFVERVEHRIARFGYITLLGIRNLWDFLFPSTSSKAEAELPEISVTLPSPADSTTEFYAHCVQEKVHPKLSSLTETKRKATSLVRISRKKEVDYDEDEEISEDESWETEESDEEEPEQPEYPYQYPHTNKWMTVKRVRDRRPLEHVEKTEFGTQHERPLFKKKDIWSMGF